MRQRAACAAALLVLAAGSARADADDCADCRYAGDLSGLFVAPRALGPGWESLAEAPADPQQDPDLRSAGVLASHSLHYTHAIHGGSEVCSAEIWRFASPAQARAAEPGVQRNGWRVAVHGNLMVMLHGVSLHLGEALRPGLLPACRRLGDRIDENARAALRAETARSPASARER
ncbi:MAG TPA: hypothetical protein VMS55_24840 [Myxococcota bacterium]|nr:hypothetical protein [Myxococcota bacterium]